MSFNLLLQNAKEKLTGILGNDPLPQFSNAYPAYILFFVVSDSVNRAHIEIATDNNFEDCWNKGVIALKKWRVKNWHKPTSLRVELVNKIEPLRWEELKLKLSRAKRNYFRFGLSFSPNFKTAVLEHELYANAVLYKTDVSVATPNEINLKNFSKRRFRKELQWPTNDNELVYRFKTVAVFTDGNETYEIESNGKNSGYRKLDQWNVDTVTDLIETSSAYLAKQVKSNGFYHYGWFPCFDRPIPTYNALRHASSTYALLEGWEVTQKEDQKQAIDRALHYLTNELIKVVELPDGSSAAFLVDIGDEIKLGGNAVSILAYAKYTEITGDQKYLEVMELLALGILFMQNPETGEYVHILNYPDLSVKSDNRTIYYDGEAAFGLMRLYGITKDIRWIKSVEKAFDYFIENKHWQAHDHWQSYCVNELTLYNPDPKYYQFGLDNIRDHLDFVLKRITTYPTLLELMMAAQKMIVRIQNDSKISHLLNDFDVEKFYQALEYRARYLLNGFFYPEVAMFFKNPQRILGGFFIRHHAFRVRIDDVEHYLSGYVAYRKYLVAHDDYLFLESNNQPLLTADNIAREVSGRWVKRPDLHWKATGISIYSLMFEPGHILVARGADNRGFMTESLIKMLSGQGASAIICENAEPFMELNIPILEVKNSRRAVLSLGMASRKLFKGNVIGVTGSAGKTTTVHMLSHALKIFGGTGHTQRSANLPIGVAWNQINMPHSAKNWVVEMAIGQMPLNSKLATPNVAVITNIGPAHLEYHFDTETIARKKSCIMDEMDPNGTLVLFGGIKHRECFIQKAEEKLLSVITYGENDDDDIQLLTYTDNMIRFRLLDEVVQLAVILPNKYIIYNVLGVFATVYALGLDWTRLLDAFKSFQLPEGRGQSLKVDQIEKTFYMYDDTYNANPLSMVSAISSLSNIKNPKHRFLILGDMKELGKEEVGYHIDLKGGILAANVAKIILCGDLMRHLWDEIEKDPDFAHIRKGWYPSVADILTNIDMWIEDEDHIVLKASNSMGFKKIIDYFMENK
ncbi:UDP-N-acetylmuramoyl-tripeptide--D-alanyl-D-alanine ligase [Ignatzschineria rhizosphaerae]|uniref:UDP-N-acetylmuramoyl-tripeptide--D-alanyl-D-alanine ligase n=1 Tax=Ignatzschineria rhizosphaerae TaxID=2923279 RepID=A0ABY3X8W8_9GAMM|nr:UDP-N-acetylmuramoyl-tripeptide--D-alanyl-D-alanine ligase [Ignatzschineria rhizosphaerae]UNM96438.1 UDP-N-acetylmuramoyl-tripeptide--D-alanyl-D-alanine ligase [Ignatzschineria rhizosphaerae]